ncbi:MAG: AAA family ATPase, partial [candidate division Zixibacteria bacterium]|nr:AAA family ATPase [candidate division Zixibacteria bacterium]
SVCHDFGLEVNGESKIDCLIKLHDFVLESYNDGKTVCLIVDEAQNLNASLLEEIRMLTNIETSNQRLFQIFLVGQPELNDLLEQNESWQMKQRISTRFHLLPLDEVETKQYIHTRMRVAGAKRLNCFTPGALHKIYTYAQGVPRLINTICNNSLLSGYAGDTPIVNEKIVRECAADLRLERAPKIQRSLERKKRGGKRKLSLAYELLAVILFGLLLVGAGLFLLAKSGISLDFSKPSHAFRALFLGNHEPEGKGIILERAEGKDEVEDTAEPEFETEAAPPVGAHIPESNSSAGSQGRPIETHESPQAPEETRPAETRVIRNSLLELTQVSRERETFQVPRPSGSPKTRLVSAREGDSIGQIVFREFGRVDGHLIQTTQNLNPEIENINQISVGQTIRLPGDLEEVYQNPGLPSYFGVHVTSFKQFDKAEEMFDRLNDIGEKPTIIPAKIWGSDWYRVTLGEHKSFTDASLHARKLIQSGEYPYAKPIKVPELKQLNKHRSAKDESAFTNAN